MLISTKKMRMLAEGHQADFERNNGNSFEIVGFRRTDQKLIIDLLTHDIAATPIHSEYIFNFKDSTNHITKIGELQSSPYSVSALGRSKKFGDGSFLASIEQVHELSILTMKLIDEGESSDLSIPRYPELLLLFNKMKKYSHEGKLPNVLKIIRDDAQKIIERSD